MDEESRFPEPIRDMQDITTTLTSERTLPAEWMRLDADSGMRPSPELTADRGTPRKSRSQAERSTMRRTM